MEWTSSVSLVALALLTTAGCTVADTLMYPFGEDMGDVLFTDSDDGAPPPFNITDDDRKFRYFDGTDELIYVNANGVVSFEALFPEFEAHTLPYEPYYLELRKFIALFWADHHLGHGGVTWSRMTDDKTLLKRARKEVKKNFRDCSKEFKPNNMIIATWENVYAYWYIYYEYYWNDWNDDYYDDEYYNNDGYYNDEYYNKKRGAADRKEKVRQRRDYNYEDYFGTNTYQLVLVTDGSQTYAMLNYERIDWIVSDYDPAVVGFDAGDITRFYQHPFSEDDLLHVLEFKSNVGVPGRWMYKVSEDTIFGPDCQEPSAP